jgi:hypothetical protein
MFKVIVMLRKRAGMSREDFIDYYTNRHVPLVHSLLPKGAAVHRRNFVIPAQPAPIDLGANADRTVQPDPDVISEVFYEDLATAQAAAKAMSEPAIRARIEADERAFLEPGSLKSYVVEVSETVFRQLDRDSWPASAQPSL